MIRSEIVVGNAKPNLLAIAGRWQCKIRQELKFRAVLRLLAGAVRVKHVVDKDPFVLVRRDKVFGILISRLELETVLENTSLEKIYSFFR